MYPCVYVIRSKPTLSSEVAHIIRQYYAMPYHAMLKPYAMQPSIQPTGHP